MKDAITFPDGATDAEKEEISREVQYAIRERLWMDYYEWERECVDYPEEYQQTINSIKQ